MKFARHALFAAITLTLADAATSRPYDDPPETPQTYYTASLTFDNLLRAATVSGDVYQSIPPSNANFFTEWVTNLLTGGGRDMGDFLCTQCSVVPTDVSAISDWGAFITSVVNPLLWPNVVGPNGQPGQWKPGDTVSICNGSGVCVILEYHTYNGTLSWFPNPQKKVLKIDKKKYKNSDQNQNNPTGVVGGVIGPLVPTYIPLPEGTLIIYTDRLLPIPHVEVGPLEPAPSGGTGGSCVHVESILPDGRRAGDVVVGDVIQLADGYSGLATTVGVVSFSKRVSQPGLRIITQSGVSLICSNTAPIWTDEGFIKAPDLVGKRVAVRFDEKDITTTFERVEAVVALGMIEVQHISVGDRAFWAGAEHGAYLLHHNKTIDDPGDDNSYSTAVVP